jgi:hypothetical protein
VASLTKALPKVQPPPTPLNVTPHGIDVALVDIVLPVDVALNVIVPDAVHTVPASNDMLPDTARVPVLEKVTTPTDTVISKQVNVPDSVTV